MEKYGFVYIWYDKKYKRYYIGSHWGKEDDGYICSSNWMRNSYKRRPKDFRRRIIKRIYTNRNDLLINEENYLKLIKPEEKGKKYYNLMLHINYTLTTKGYHHSKETVEKISKSNKGLKRSEETKQKIREANYKQFLNEEQRELRRKKSLELWNDPEYRRINTENKKGKKQSKETRLKRSESLLKTYNEKKIK